MCGFFFFFQTSDLEQKPVYPGFPIYEVCSFLPYLEDHYED